MIWHMVVMVKNEEVKSEEFVTHIHYSWTHLLSVQLPHQLHRGHLLSDIPSGDLLATLEHLMESNTVAQFLQNILSHLRTGPGSDSFQLDILPGALVQMNPSVLNNPHRYGHISTAIHVEQAGYPVDPH
jgi:hypothetical protein